ncbi:MAG: hypothetical protein RSC98_08420, partial [Clostridia bacterium]
VRNNVLSMFPQSLHMWKTKIDRGFPLLVFHIFGAFELRKVLFFVENYVETVGNSCGQVSTVWRKKSRFGNLSVWSFPCAFQQCCETRGYGWSGGAFFPRRGA